MKEFVSLKKAAELLNLGTRQVSTLAEKGMPARSRGGRREYAWPESLHWYIKQKVDAGIRAQQPADWTKARARKMAADADLAEIELATARGELVSLDVHEKRLDDICGRVASVLDTVPSKYLGRIQTARSELEAQEVGEKIREESKAALYGIADELEDEPSHH